jgi:hypothetical protein
MDLDKIINEIYEKGGGNYPAYSTPPRKDYVPLSTRNTPNYPYQQGTPQDDLTNPPPESVPSMPWPLGTAVDDFADSFVFLASGMDKISTCVKNNPSLSSKQKDDLINLYKISKDALSRVREVGLVLTRVANIAGPQPSQNPVPTSEYHGPETDPMKNTVKIRVK